VSGVSDFRLDTKMRGICGPVAASSESLLVRFDMTQVAKRKRGGIAGRPNPRRMAQPRVRDQFCSGQRSGRG